MNETQRPSEHPNSSRSLRLWPPRQSVKDRLAGRLDVIRGAVLQNSPVDKSGAAATRVQADLANTYQAAATQLEEIADVHERRLQRIAIAAQGIAFVFLPWRVWHAGQTLATSVWLGASSIALCLTGAYFWYFTRVLFDPRDHPVRGSIGTSLPLFVAVLWIRFSTANLSYLTASNTGVSVSFGMMWGITATLLAGGASMLLTFFAASLERQRVRDAAETNVIDALADCVSYLHAAGDGELSTRQQRMLVAKVERAATSLERAVLRGSFAAGARTRNILHHRAAAASAPVRRLVRGVGVLSGEDRRLALAQGRRLLTLAVGRRWDEVIAGESDSEPQPTPGPSLLHILAGRALPLIVAAAAIWLALHQGPIATAPGGGPVPTSDHASNQAQSQLLIGALGSLAAILASVFAARGK